MGHINRASEKQKRQHRESRSHPRDPRSHRARRIKSLGRSSDGAPGSICVSGGPSTNMGRLLAVDSRQVEPRARRTATGNEAARSRWGSLRSRWRESLVATASPCRARAAARSHVRVLRAVRGVVPPRGRSFGSVPAHAPGERGLDSAGSGSVGSAWAEIVATPTPPNSSMGIARLLRAQRAVALVLSHPRATIGAWLRLRSPALELRGASQAPGCV